MGLIRAPGLITYFAPALSLQHARYLVYPCFYVSNILACRLHTSHYLTAVQYIYSVSNFSSLSNLHDQGSTVGADHASRQILVLDRVEEGFGHIFDLSNLARRHFGFK